MSVDHYENFPVASFLLPARLQGPVKAIYAFARRADDIADEGTFSAEERLAGLETFRQALFALEAGRAVEGSVHGEAVAPLFDRLALYVRAYNLPLQLFHDLLDAFSQDVVKTRYACFAELHEYCRRSANPVGRLLLYLYEQTSEDCLRRSDAICSSLQLINFWQDVAIDWEKGRIYLPEEDLHCFDVNEEAIHKRVCDERWRALMAFEVSRARAMMEEGAPLARYLGGRIGWELRLVVQGGLRILEKIEAVDYDVFNHRPVLKRSDWIKVVWRAVQM